MNKILMPKANAAWLYENTNLTFEQIADFCGLHRLEVQALANEEVVKVHPINPVVSGILSEAEIARCEKDEAARLRQSESDLPKPSTRSKGPRYTPLAKRGDKPDAISWCLKNAPELTDAQIVRLVGTTKNTIEKVRTRTHWNMQNIQPQHPVALGLCNQQDFDKTMERAQKKLEKAAEKAKQPKKDQEVQDVKEADVTPPPTEAEPEKTAVNAPADGFDAA